MQSYKLVLSFGRAGDVFAKLTLDTIFLQTFYSFMALLSDALFAVMLLGITIYEVVRAVKSCKAGTFRKTAASGWFILQWLIILLGWAAILGYQYIDFQLVNVKKDMEASANTGKSHRPHSRKRWLGMFFCDHLELGAAIFCQFWISQSADVLSWATPHGVRLCALLRANHLAP